MVLLVLEAEFCDGTNCLDLHDVWPGLQKGGVLSRVYMGEVLGKKVRNISVFVTEHKFFSDRNYDYFIILRQKYPLNIFQVSKCHSFVDTGQL